MARPSAKLAPTLLALALAFACAGCNRNHTSNAKSEIRFPHAKHVGEADCSDCHGGVEKSTTASAGKFIPNKKKCAECHEDAVKDKKECRKCHVGQMKGSKIVRGDLRKLRFNHAAHVKKKIACKQCHNPKAKTRQALIPRHATCNTSGCHRKEERRMLCNTCHLALDKMGYQPLASIKHTINWAKTHGNVARQNIGVCTQCHDQPYCAKCHARTAAGKPSLLFPTKIAAGFRHRGDWVSRHSIEARSNPTTCAKCHGQRGCRACHALQGLASPLDKSQVAAGKRTTHPAGWMTSGSPDFHGRAARRNIATCAGCHDRGAASNCVTCHKVGGTGGNPHPPGFRWRNKDNRCRTQTMCVTCHTGGQGCPR